MVTDVQSYEYPGKKMIIRTIVKKLDEYIQIIVDDKEAACYKKTGTVSFSRNGYIYYTKPDDKKNYIIDVNKFFQEEPQQVPAGAIIHPGGIHVVGYETNCMGIPGYEHFSGLVMTEIKTNEKSILWKKNVMKQINKPYIYIADDGETWLLLTTGMLMGLEIGKGNNHLGSADIAMKDKPPSVSFDLKQQSIFITDSENIYLLSMEGEIKYQWNNKIPCKPCKEYGRTLTEKRITFESPVVFRKDEALVVTKETKETNEYSIVQINKDNKELHKILDFTLKNTKYIHEKAGFLCLADGSLAIMPQKEKIIIIPGDGAARKSSTWIEVIGVTTHGEDSHSKTKNLKLKVLISTYSKTKTPHIMYPQFEDVFVDELNIYKDKLLPVFSLDLKDLQMGDEKVFMLYTETLDPDCYYYTISPENKIDAIELFRNNVLIPFKETYVEEIGKSGWISFEEMTIDIEEPDPGKDIDWAWQQSFQGELARKGFKDDMIRAGGYPVFLQGGYSTIDKNFICQKNCFGSYFYLFRAGKNKFFMLMQMT